ncbi:MAG: TIR domain-containing protein [Promethearchaeota archaeon]
MSVEYGGQFFKVINKKGSLILDLSNQGIRDISEIKGLDNLVNLRYLNLNKNQITEIKGLDNLRILETLSLENNNISEIKGLDNLNLLQHLLLNGNNITEIKGLGNLSSLKRIELQDNPVRASAKEMFGRYWSNPQPMVKYCQQKVPEIREHEKVKKSKEETIQYLKNLPSIYEEITFEEISLKTGYSKRELKALTEDLILKGDIPGSIRENIIIFKKELLTEALQEETIPIEKQSKKIFVSYATKDAELFKIKEIAKGLRIYDEIEEVLYYEAESYDNFVKYMNDNLGRCDVVLLFCSPNSLESGPVEKEWTAADAMNKPIIPVFIRADHIPPLLKSRLGVEFDTFNMEKNIEEIYRIIMKR